MSEKTTFSKLCTQFLYSENKTVENVFSTSTSLQKSLCKFFKSFFKNQLILYTTPSLCLPTFVTHFMVRLNAFPVIYYLVFQL